MELCLIITSLIILILLKAPKQQTTQIDIELSEEAITIGSHFKSKDLLYDGNFTKLTCCSNCKRVRDYWSNNSSVCEQCGGQLVKTHNGKWDNKIKKWIPPIKFEQ